MSAEVSKTRKTFKVPGVVNYYVGITINIILLYALNNIRYLNSSVLDTNKYISCLWAINLALTIGILGNFILLILRPRWLYHATQLAMNLTIILAFYIIYQQFPFTFVSETYQTAVKVILIIIMAGTGIGAIVELVRLGLVFLDREKPAAIPVTSLIVLPSSGPDTPPQDVSSETPLTPELNNAPAPSVEPDSSHPSDNGEPPKML
jgi:hypothetical protein